MLSFLSHDDVVRCLVDGVAAVINLVAEVMR